MSSYVIKNGDTFASIARTQLGDDSLASIISSGNPGVIEPLPVGKTIFLVDTPQISASSISPTSTTNSNVRENQTTVTIDGVAFKYWSTINIKRSFSANDILEMTALFEPRNEEFKAIFKPFSYKSVVVKVAGELIFNGILMEVTPVITKNSKTVLMSCYSLPGVLNDCTQPVGEDIKYQFNEMNLEEITKTIVKPFGLGVVFDSDPGPIFNDVRIAENKIILRFLTKLATQRGLVISSTADGKVLFRKSAITPPVASIEEGAPPLLSIVPDFKPQEYYSHVTGIQPTALGIPGSQYTLANTKLTDSLRPLVFTVNDAADGDNQTAVEAKVGRMFANSVSYNMELSSWRDSKAVIWTPGATISVFAEGAMIYKKYNFLIRSVDLFRDDNLETAKLNLVLPGAFSGEIPKDLPWD